MRSIIHCPWCSSRTDMLTDGDGRLVERLNHPCTCPAIDRRVKVTVPPGPKQVRRKRHCVDCDAEITGWAKRCAEHSKIHKRKVTVARERQRRLERRLA